MNDELIEQLIEVVTEHPKRYTQDSFGIIGHSYEDWVIEGSCGSPCCIAGHVMILTGNETPCKWDWGTLDPEDWLIEVYNELKGNASNELGITRNQGLALFASVWPRVWVDDDNGPLPLVDVNYSQTDEKLYSPTAEDAIKVLDRLLHYGFSHSTFEEYYRERERDNE